MRLGLLLPTMQSLDVNRMALRGAEQLGVDDVWVLDHMMGLTHPDVWPLFPPPRRCPTPTRCSIRSASRPRWARPLTCRWACASPTPPGAAAAIWPGPRLTLQDACRGGFTLGIGSGEAESILPFGYDYSAPVGKVETALRELRSMLDHGRMPEGIGRTGLPRDGGIPQVWVAAHQPRMLRLTGTYADGWLPLPSSVDRYREQYDVIQEAAAHARRPAPVASLVPATILGDSRDHVLKVLEQVPVARLIAYYLPAATWAAHGLEHPGGPECRGQVDVIPHAIPAERLIDIAERIPTELVEELVWMGNAEEIAERIAPYAEAGTTHLMLGDVTGLTYTPAETAAGARHPAAAAQDLARRTVEEPPMTSEQTREIVPEDDSWAHHARPDDPFWNESGLFGFMVPDRRIDGYFYVWHRPNMNLTSAGVALWDDIGSETHNCLYSEWFHFNPMAPGTDMFDFELGNGMRCKVLEPLKTIPTGLHQRGVLRSTCCGRGPITRRTSITTTARRTASTSTAACTTSSSAR